MPEPTIRVTLRCFAAVREVLGTDAMALEVAVGTTVEGLRQRLAAQRPELARIPVAYAVNRDYARAESVLADGDEVAFIPPISGGSGARDLYRFDLVLQPIDPRALEAECRTDSDGAVVTFLGTTRDQNEGAAVERLQYEAYPEMAQKVMCALFEEAIKRYPITRARVVHRLGDVPVGETSVAIVVASPHRGPAFDACRFLIDRLKSEVPIWKREQLRRGDEARWIGELPHGAGS
ncbi:MAG: molybdenum cofactor biosynthesis protein MoaE [Planctomycetes bacterium]|nr:molybdenum cofactor biosynthesis protein MoaE [Planctomycetota bacterium]